MDSLYQNSDTDKKEIQTINGIGIVNNSPNAKVDLVDLRAENKALKMVIEEKDKRLAEQQKYIDQALENGLTWYSNSDIIRTRGCNSL